MARCRPTALVTTTGKEKQMKGKIFTVAGRTLIRTMIVSVFVAAVLALGTPAQASLRPASAHTRK